jgi:hypothetical protein
VCGNLTQDRFFAGSMEGTVVAFARLVAKAGLSIGLHLKNALEFQGVDHADGRRSRRLRNQSWLFFLGGGRTDFRRHAGIDGFASLGSPAAVPLRTNRRLTPP